MKFSAYTNLFISVAAVFHSIASYVLTDQEINYSALVFIFSSTLFLYNFLRITKLKTIPAENHSDQLLWVAKKIKLITIITFSALFISFIFFFFLSRWQILIVLMTGIIALGYNLSFGKNQMSLRKIPFMKAIWISFVWTSVTLVLPMSENQISFDWQLFLLRFLFVYTLTIPFDIRDMKYDDKSMKTAPQLFGNKGAVTLGCVFLMTCFCIAFDIFENRKAMVLSISYGITAIVLLISLKNRKEIFYPLAVDGMMILQGGLLMINEEIEF